MVLINILDHVKKCYSNDDGRIIFNEIKKAFQNNEQVTISFSGITSLNTSFVNSALVELIDHYSFDYIRSNLKFINTTMQINTIIRDRFIFEAKKKKLAVAN